MVPKAQHKILLSLSRWRYLVLVVFSHPGRHQNLFLLSSRVAFSLLEYFLNCLFKPSATLSMLAYKSSCSSETSICPALVSTVAFVVQMCAPFVAWSAPPLDATLQSISRVPRIRIRDCFPQFLFHVRANRRRDFQIVLALENNFPGKVFERHVVIRVRRPRFSPSPRGRPPRRRPRRLTTSS